MVRLDTLLHGAHARGTLTFWGTWGSRSWQLL